MSHYKNQEFDFVERTKEILMQYEEFQVGQKDKYDVTLLLNCLVGLLILPQQHWFAHLPEDFVSRKEWGIDGSHIAFIKTGETKSVKNISRHLRNSVAHYRFKVFSNSKDEISMIKFEDFDRQSQKTFEATIPIMNLKEFVNRFSSSLISMMEDQKP